MNRDGEDDTTTYDVVVNHEEQYSIWPSGKEMPLGWTSTGETGAKADCLAYIQRRWIDMRPLGLRRSMAEGDSSSRSSDALPLGRDSAPKDTE